MLNAMPYPYAITFLKKSLPFLAGRDL